MKKIYILLTILLMLATWSCKTKKSTTDFKQTETEKIGISDNSTISKTETVEEKTDISKTQTTADKSFFEAWMSFESDKITITDKNGTMTEITNPRINKKSSQKADVTKTEQTDSKTNKVAVGEENQQNDVKADSSKEKKIDLQQKDSSKGKEPVWLYVVGAVVGGVFGWYVWRKI